MSAQATRRRAFMGLSAGLGLAGLGFDPRALGAVDAQERAPGKVDRSPRDVVAEVMLAARQFAADESIPFAFRITNHSPRAVVIWSSGFWPNHLVEVRDAEGREMPLTGTGELRRRSFSPSGARRKNIPFKLKPGESWPPRKEGEDPLKQGESGGLGLDRLFELKPGTFTLKLTYHDESAPTPLKLESPEVTFKILPAEAKGPK